MDAFMNSVIRKTKEEGMDWYPTQAWGTRVLLEQVPLSGTVWEPACGGGHMAEVLRESGADVISSDVHDYGYGGVHDFLEGEPTPFGPVDWIVTNPPFHSKMSLQFTHRALSITPNVAILARLSWLEGAERERTLFRPTPPSRVIVITDRLGFWADRCEIGHRGMLPYAWYVWEEGSTGTELTWAPAGSMERLTVMTDHVRFNNVRVVSRS